MIRIFYAHASGDDSDVIAQGCAGIKELVRAKGERAGKDVKVTVVPGRDDFRAHCRGDWDVWAKSVVHREHAITRKPFYDLIVIPTPYVGRATAQIVNVAIRAGRPVFLLSNNSEGNSSLERITQVYPYDIDDWQGGYRCEKEQPSVSETND
tara:strand:- start:72 stop:527 length:456 start_codon:yes stop_codon:yes gene_type:complete